MGAARNPFLTREDDPRHIELVAKIAQKTRLKKISWRRTGTGVTASIPGGLEFSFVLSVNFFAPFGIAANWQLFTVRQASGQELLKIENLSGVPALLGPTPLQSAVTNLFEAVRGSASDDLDSAINAVDRM